MRKENQGIDKYHRQKIAKHKKDVIIRKCEHCEYEFIVEDYSDSNMIIETRPCELCGEHGSISIKVICHICGKLNIVQLEEW